jgi:thiamine-monophosphate kinase
VLAASGIGARLDLESIPFSAASRRCLSREHAEQAALAGGDDYELCVVLAPEALAKAQAVAKSVGVQLTVIGSTQQHPGLELVRGGESVKVSAEAYQHFAVEAS